MIGCERLCGRCDRCGSLTWALLFDRPELYIGEFIIGPEKETALRTILAPSSLADLLARAYIGRTADPDVTHGLATAEGLRTTDPAALLYVQVFRSRFCFTPERARAALSRLLALPLDCGADAAIAALEE